MTVNNLRYKTHAAATCGGVNDGHYGVNKLSNLGHSEAVGPPIGR